MLIRLRALKSGERRAMESLRCGAAPADHPLFALPNVIVTPMGGSTDELRTDEDGRSNVISLSSRARAR